jgi:hypothetical protein
MISIKFDANGSFKRQMNNLVEYSYGFIDGANKGKRKFLQTLGEGVREILSDFIDSNARIDSNSLHHVYEWYQAGSPDARLFEISYTVSNLGLSVKSDFSQSTSVAEGSNVPFYDKAKIMESGMSVTVAPVRAKFLKFESMGEEVFTPNPVSISSPGGEPTTGGFQRVFDMFFQNYFQQSFIQASGLRRSFEDVSIYKKNLQAGLSGGRAAGVSTGQRWIANVRIDSR